MAWKWLNMTLKQYERWIKSTDNEVLQVENIRVESAQNDLFERRSIVNAEVKKRKAALERSIQGSKDARDHFLNLKERPRNPESIVSGN